MIGEKIVRDVSAFAPTGDLGPDVDPMRNTGAATPSIAVTHHVGGRAIDGRWWLAALAVGAGLWTAILSV